MSFIKLLQRRTQGIKNIAHFWREYEGRSKGSMYRERRFLLKKAINDIDNRIGNYGNGNIYNWKGKMEIIGPGGIMVIKDFEVILDEVNSKEVIAFIEHRLKCNVLQITSDRITKGKIYS